MPGWLMRAARASSPLRRGPSVLRMDRLDQTAADTVEPVDWAAMRVRRWFDVRRDSMMSVGF
jgi:hypothetical protein